MRLSKVGTLFEVSFWKRICLSFHKPIDTAQILKVVQNKVLLGTQQTFCPTSSQLVTAAPAAEHPRPTVHSPLGIVV